jgi:hypothetical protein
MPFETQKIEKAIENNHTSNPIRIWQGMRTAIQVNVGGIDRPNHCRQVTSGGTSRDKYMLCVKPVIIMGLFAQSKGSYSLLMRDLEISATK